jgi:tetratricopeptide (TPR) repeat protein
MNKLNTRFALLLVGVLFILAAGTAVAHHFQTARIGQALLWQADKAEGEDHPDQAVKHLSRYLEFRPDDNEQRARLGKLLAEDRPGASPRSRERALFVLEQVLAREPARNDLRPLVVKLALGLKRWKVAEEHLQVLRKAAPEDGKVAALTAQWYEGQKQLTEAEQWYAKAAKFAPGDIDSYLRHAELLQRRLRKDKATARVKALDDVYDNLIANNPKSARAYLARYSYRYKAGAIADATQDLEQAAALAPNDVDVVLAVAAFAQNLKQYDKGRAELVRALKLYPNEVRLYEAIAWLEIQAGRRDVGLDYVRQVLKSARGEARRELLWSLANLLLDGGDVAEAEKAIAELRTVGVNPPVLSYLEARVLVCKTQWAAAARLLERARPQLEGSPQVTRQLDLFLARCYSELHEPAPQLAACQRVLAQDPDCAAARIGAASAQGALGRTADALAEYRQLTAHPAAPPAARLELARLLILHNLQTGDKDWQKVDKALREAAEANPDSVEVVLLRVEALAAQGQSDGALELLDEARRREPNRVEFRTMLAALLLRRGEPEKAVKLLDEAEAATGDGVLLRLARARYLATRPLVEAGPALTKLGAGLDQFSADDRARLLGGLAEVWLRLGDARQAEKIWTELAQQPRYQSDTALRLLLFDLALGHDDEPAMQRLTAELQRLEGQQGPLTRYALAARILWRASRGQKTDLDEARVHLDFVTAQKPAWAVAQLARAELEILKGNQDQAIAHFKKAGELGERGPRVVRKLVELLYQKQRYAEADEEIRRLHKQTLVAADLHRLAADLSLRNQDLTRAVELASEAVSADSKDYRDHLWLGQVLAVSGKEPARAEAELRKAVALAPQAPAAWVALVRYLVFTDQREAASKALAEAQAQLPAAKMHLATGQCQEALGDLDKAQAAYRAALEAQPEDTDVLRANAAFCLRYGKFQAASPLLEKLLARKSKLTEADAAWARHNLAIVTAANGDYPQFLKALAMVDMTVDKTGKAVETPNAGTGPEEVRARAHVLALQPQRPNRKKAIALLEKLRDNQALTPEDQLLLARLYNAEGNWPKTRALLSELVTKVNQTPLFLMAYADGLLAHKELAEANVIITKLEALETLNKVETGTYGSVQLRALWHEASGDAAKAVALITAHINRPNAPPDEFLLLVRHLAKQKRLDEALDVCEKALEKVPVAQVTTAAAVALRGNQPTDAQCQRVEGWLKAALAKQPGATVLKLHLADLQEIRGRYQDMETTYRGILQDEPQNVAALNNQAWLLAQSDNRAAEALPLINRAIELMGPRPELLDTRGLVQLKMGRADLAVGDLERVTAEAPTAARWFHLACAYRQAHNPEAARRAFRHARELGLQLTQLHPLERGHLGAVFEELGKE